MQFTMCEIVVDKKKWKQLFPHKRENETRVHIHMNIIHSYNRGKYVECTHTGPLNIAANMLQSYKYV